jgi:hypothetical protein
MTNLMPILRGEILSGGGPLELTAAWVTIPELSAVLATGDPSTFAVDRARAQAIQTGVGKLCVMSGVAICRGRPWL